MTNAIQTGLLAYGMSGKVFHAPFLATHPGFTLRAVTERHRKQAAADYPGIRSYDSVEALLQDPETELVVVNTPNNTHFAFAEQALRAGKHVLIEKPVATSAAEVRALWALGRQVGKHVLAYQNRRWDSDFQAVRQVVESGRLGRLFEVTFRFDRYKSALNKKTFKEEPIPGSGLLYDLGPHLLDQAISLFGQPRACRKITGRYRPGSQVDDYFSLHLRYPNELHVFVASGLLVAQPQPAFVLHGTQGSFVKHRRDVQEAQLLQGLSPQAASYGWEDAGAEGMLTLADAPDGKTTTAVPSPRGNYAQLFDVVYQTIRRGAPYPVRAAHVLWQLQMLEQPSDEFIR